MQLGAVKKLLKGRLLPLLERCGPVAEIMPTSRMFKTTVEIYFPNPPLFLTSSESPASLQSRPFPCVMSDEARSRFCDDDKYLKGRVGDYDPLSLVPASWGYCASFGWTCRARVGGTSGMTFGDRVRGRRVGCRSTARRIRGKSCAARSTKGAWCLTTWWWTRASGHRRSSQEVISSGLSLERALRRRQGWLQDPRQDLAVREIVGRSHAWPQEGLADPRHRALRVGEIRRYHPALNAGQN